MPCTASASLVTTAASCGPLAIPTIPASPKLLQAAVVGQHGKPDVVEVVRPGGCPPGTQPAARNDAKPVGICGGSIPIPPLVPGIWSWITTRSSRSSKLPLPNPKVRRPVLEIVRHARLRQHADILDDAQVQGNRLGPREPGVPQ